MESPSESGEALGRVGGFPRTVVVVVCDHVPTEEGRCDVCFQRHHGTIVYRGVERGQAVGGRRVGVTAAARGGLLLGFSGSDGRDKTRLGLRELNRTRRRFS